jgi:hypothetical protein
MDLERLVQAVREDPLDSNRFGVLADWLEEP